MSRKFSLIEFISLRIFSVSPHWAYVRFSNRTPDYVLATQLALKRIRGCVSVSSLGLVRVAFQDE